MRRRPTQHSVLDMASALLVALCLLLAGGVGSGWATAPAPVAVDAPCGGGCLPDADGGCCCDPTAARCLCAIDAEDDPRHADAPLTPAPQRIELRLLLVAARIAIHEPLCADAPAQRPIWSSRLPVALGDSRAIRLRTSLILT